MNGPRSFTSLGASAQDLDTASAERLLDAQALHAAGRWASSIAMGLYSLETRLKARICRQLDLLRLPRPFEIHELDGLLLLSGLSRRLNQRSARPVKRNWNEVKKLAKDLNDLRYKPDPRWSQTLADDVLKWLVDPKEGVLPWIASQV